MENAPLYLREITETASASGCDVLILSREIFDMYQTELPEYLGDGEYVYNDSGKDYIIYVRGNSVYSASESMHGEWISL